MEQVAVGPEAVLESFRQLVVALHAQAIGPADPWYDWPLTMPQLRAFSLIAASQVGLSSRELATRLGVGPSAITPLVDRLVEHGLVCRREDPRDRRVARLQATPAGSALLERMRAGKDDRLLEALYLLTPEQLHLVDRALRVLRSAVETEKENENENRKDTPA